MNKDAELTTELMSDLILQHKTIVNSRFKKLDNYYSGKQDILNRTLEDTTKPNNKVVSNFCSYVSDVMTGFFMGKPVEYKTENLELLTQLNKVLRMNDEDTENYTLAHKSSIKGQAFELIYCDEQGDFCFDVLDTDSVIIIYDNTIKQNILYGIRYYDTLEDDEEVTYIEVYTNDAIISYKQVDDNMTQTETRQHYFGEVPIIEYANGRFRKSDFENIITLQDAYNLNTADISNDIEYFSNCYLSLSGMEDTEASDVLKMKEDRVIVLPNGGQAGFLTKNINDTVVQNHRENIKEDIHKMAYVPDLSKEINSNVSGTAMKNRFFTTYQAVANKERMFKKGLQKRLRLFVNYLNFKNVIGKEHNAWDVEIQFNKNIPINMIEFADSAIKLAGVLPYEMVVEELNKQGLEINVDRAVKLKESENSMNLYDNSIPDLVGVEEDEQ